MEWEQFYLCRLASVDFIEDFEWGEGGNLTCWEFLMDGTEGTPHFSQPELWILGIGAVITGACLFSLVVISETRWEQ